MARYRRSKTNPKYFQDIPKKQEKKMTYCEYCGTEETECRFGATPESRIGCDNLDCPALKVFRKNLDSAPDGYPKSKEDYLPLPLKLYDKQTGKKIDL